MNTVIVHGPMACGKTTNAEALRAMFGCSAIIDNWRPSDLVRGGGLHLTSWSYHADVTGVGGARVVPFEKAMQQLTRKSLREAGMGDDHEELTFHGRVGSVTAERVSVLTEAEGLVHGARNETYGHPLDDFTRTAGMVSAMLAHKLKAPLTAEEIGMVMCCIKLSRQVHSPKRDNMVDLAGYAETVQWCGDERAKRATSQQPA